MGALDTVSFSILLGAGLILAGILSSLVALRFGAPLLLGFLGVGILYQFGLGVTQSPSEAASWYLAAHAMRDNRARQLLGDLGLGPAETRQAVTRANQLLQSYRRRERVTDPGA